MSTNLKQRRSPHPASHTPINTQRRKPRLFGKDRLSRAALRFEEWLLALAAEGYYNSCMFSLENFDWFETRYSSTISDGFLSWPESYCFIQAETA